MVFGLTEIIVWGIVNIRQSGKCLRKAASSGIARSNIKADLK